MKKFCERCKSNYGKTFFYNVDVERCKCGTFLTYFPDVIIKENNEDEVQTPIQHVVESRVDTNLSVGAIINEPQDDLNKKNTIRPRLSAKGSIENNKGNKSNISSIVDELFNQSGIIGMGMAKEQLNRYYHEYDIETLKEGIDKKSVEDRTINSMSFFVKGDELCGKTELSKIVTKLLYKLGVRKNETLEMISVTEFQAALGDESNIEDLFKPYKDKTVLIDESLDHVFLDVDGKSEVDALKINDILRAIKKINTEVTVIFEITPKLCNEMYLINSRLNDYFLTLNVGSYSSDELYKIVIKRITGDFKYSISEDGKRQLKNRINTAVFDRFSQGRFVLKLFEEARIKMEQRLRTENNNTSINDKFTLIKSDFQDRVYDEKLVNAALDEINSREGQSEIKEYAKRIVTNVHKNHERILNGKAPLKVEQPNFVLEGDSGTGKSSGCELLARLLFACGILKDEKPMMISIGELQTSAVGGTPEKVKNVFLAASGRMLVIDEAYSLLPKGDVSGNFGQEVVDSIVNELGKSNDVVVVLLGYPGTVDPAVLNMNRGMRGRFPNTITLESYSLKEMVKIFINHAKLSECTIEDGAEELVEKLIEIHYKEADFSNARGVINLFDSVVSRSDHMNDIITKSDLLKKINEDTAGSSVKDILHEINNLIGLKEVKTLINDLINQQLGRQKQIQAGLMVGKPLSLNHIYLGPKGTGKTTVARLVAKLYAKLGLIKYSDKFKEISAKDLIAGYVGQTEERVTKIFNEANGGVLYIDEFYQLDNGNAFGQSAIDALCTGLEAQGENLMVIISGYKDETVRCLEKNEGLRSRFRTEIQFESFSPDELFEIFKGLVKKYGLRFDEEGEVPAIVRRWIENEARKSDFANARAVRNFAENILVKQQSRIGVSEDCPIDELNLIIAEDIPDFNSEEG